MRRSICVAGKNRIAVEVLKNLQVEGFELTVCPVDSDTGTDSWQPSLKNVATTLGIPTISLSESYELTNLLFLSLEFDKIIKPHLFKDSILINVHFSLLPAYKGCFTSIWPLYFGEKYSCVTLHCINEGIVTGDILDRESITLGSEMTARDLYERYQDLVIRLIRNNIGALFEGDISGRRGQSPEDSTYYSRTSLSIIGTELVTKATAMQIKNQVRAFYFPEHQVGEFLGRKISGCEITDDRSTKKPGTTIDENQDSLWVSSIDFDVVLKKFNQRLRGECE